jgi:hypothetical protein
VRIVVAIVVPIIVGVVAAFWTPLQFWFDMKEGLVAFLGFLSASLVQIMPVTANFLQSDRLTPSEAQRLIKALTRQQHYWIGLLIAAIFAMVVVIVGAALRGRTQVQIGQIQFDAAPYVVGLIAASITFVLTRMLGLFNGLMSLHRLRSKLVVATAKRNAEDTARLLTRRFSELPATPLPDGYGEMVDPP